MQPCCHIHDLVASHSEVQEDCKMQENKLTTHNISETFLYQKNKQEREPTEVLKSLNISTTCFENAIKDWFEFLCFLLSTKQQLKQT
jgi:hypothetical protein